MDSKVMYFKTNITVIPFVIFPQKVDFLSFFGRGNMTTAMKNIKKFILQGGDMTKGGTWQRGEYGKGYYGI